MARKRTARKVYVDIYVQTQKITDEQNKKWFNKHVLPIIKSYLAKGYDWKTARKMATKEYQLFKGELYEQA
jgi:hypothetical protein